MFSRYGHEIEFMSKLYTIIQYTMSRNKGINSVLGQDSYMYGDVRVKGRSIQTASNRTVVDIWITVLLRNQNQHSMGREVD